MVYETLLLALQRTSAVSPAAAAAIPAVEPRHDAMSFGVCIPPLELTRDMYRPPIDSIHTTR